MRTLNFLLKFPVSLKLLQKESLLKKDEQYIFKLRNARPVWKANLLLLFWKQEKEQKARRIKKRSVTNTSHERLQSSKERQPKEKQWTPYVLLIILISKM